MSASSPSDLARAEQRRRDRRRLHGRIRIAVAGDILLVLFVGMATLILSRIAAEYLAPFPFC